MHVAGKIPHSFANYCTSAPTPTSALTPVDFNKILNFIKYFRTGLGIVSEWGLRTLEVLQEILACKFHLKSIRKQLCERRNISFFRLNPDPEAPRMWGYAEWNQTFLSVGEPCWVAQSPTRSESELPVSWHFPALNLVSNSYAKCALSPAMLFPNSLLQYTHINGVSRRILLR